MNTPKGKRVKVWAFNPLNGLAYVSITWTFGGTYFDDDITVIGVELNANDGITGVKAYVPDAHDEMIAVASLTGVLSQNGQLLRIKRRDDDIDGANALVGRSIRGAVMFPEGYGIDLDAGSYIYGGMFSRINLDAGGTRSWEMNLIVYYVER